MLISQPGSDYQIASISLDAGYTRDLILMLTDVHAVLDLYRFRTRRRCCDLRIGRMSWLRQDRGLCPFDCST
jgi:hypothetical protein